MTAAGEERVAEFSLNVPPRPIVAAAVRCGAGSFGIRLDCSPDCLLSDRQMDGLRQLLGQASAAAFEAELAARRAARLAGRSAP